ncbi:MAG: hypothetical protein Q9181_006759 [Wetmoreana brouardii]
MMEGAGRRVLDVLSPMLSSGDPDRYGREKVLPPPLCFDRVNEGRGPSSTALLLGLPSEILGMILTKVASDSLASLALVSRDCLQLARSRQFASIRLDYSISSSELVNRLILEGYEFSVMGTDTSIPRLGVCIRHITVTTDSDWVRIRHGLSRRGWDLEGPPANESTSRMVAASKAFFGRYVPAIQAILNHTILPHLELLDWEDAIDLPQLFYEKLALSPIKHLKLFRVGIDKQCSIPLRESFATQTWPLRTLHLELYLRKDLLGKISTGPLCESILRLCSPTLEYLRLETMGEEDPYTSSGATIDTLPRFPNLRRLSIGRVEFEDSSMLQALIHNGLRHWRLPGHGLQPTRISLNAVG